MLKRALIHAAAVAGLSTLAAGPAHATDGPAFDIFFYSDASHTTQVGFAAAICTPDPAAQLRRGVSSQYEEVVFVGQCVDGVLYYD